MTGGGVWVFGYGSLVSPASFGQTLGRELRPGRDLFEAELKGWGRRWNYGVGHWRGLTVESGRTRAWTIVALGIDVASDESTHGVVARVTTDELVELDLRERHYDRVDVTAAATVLVGQPADGVDGPIVAYVPRQEAVERYELARDGGTGAIEQRYWDLVDRAFAALGDDRRVRYHATTPAPDVPVIEMDRDPLPERPRVDRT